MKPSPHSGLAPASNGVSYFQITTDLCPQAMLRILGLIAQNSLIPRSVVCERSDDQLDIEIAVDCLTPERADTLLAKFSTIVTVRRALLIGS